MNDDSAHRQHPSHPIIGIWATRAQTLIGDMVVEFELIDDVVTLTQIAVDAEGRQSLIVSTADQVVMFERV